MLRCSGGGYRRQHEQNQYSDQKHVVPFLAHASVPTLYQTGVEIVFLEFLEQRKINKLLMPNAGMIFDPHLRHQPAPVSDQEPSETGNAPPVRRNISNKDDEVSCS
jgi:hypothetical protein